MSQDVRRLIESIGEDVSGRVTRQKTCPRTCFSDLLDTGLADIRYAYDGAYRQLETLSLAQRSEYGLPNHSTLAAPSSSLPCATIDCGDFSTAVLVREAAALPPTAPSPRAAVLALPPRSLGACVAQRYASNDVPRLTDAGPVNDRTFSGRKPSRHCSQYRSFTARVGEYSIRCVVFRGRSFAGGAIWTR
jgi:hypothetical protein